MFVFGDFLVRFFPAFGLNADRISPYVVQMRENMYQKNSEYEHFSCSAYLVWSLAFRQRIAHQIVLLEEAMWLQLDSNPQPLSS